MTAITSCWSPHTLQPVAKVSLKQLNHSRLETHQRLSITLKRNPNSLPWLQRRSLDALSLPASLVSAISLPLPPSPGDREQKPGQGPHPDPQCSFPSAPIEWPFTGGNKCPQISLTPPWLQKKPDYLESFKRDRVS